MRRIATVAVVLPMLLAPAVADAAKKKGKVNRPPGTPVSAALRIVKVNGPAGTIGTATATCPKGKQVLSGGWKQIGASQTSAISVYQSLRSGKRAWRVTGVMTGTVSGKITLIGYAYCRAGAPLSKRSATKPIPLLNNDFNAGTVTAPCRKRQSVVSGGFSIPMPTPTTAGFVHQSSRQSGRSWSATVTAGTVESTPSLALTTLAYCGRTTPFKLRKKTVPAPPALAPGTTFPVSVNSPKCKPMASGGFRAPSVIATPAVSTIPVILESRRLGKSGPWRSSMLYAGTAVDSTILTSSGYCG